MNFVWSLSKWRDYETCPTMFHHKHILKEHVDKPSPAVERGREVHKAFENAVKHGVALPKEFVSWDDVLSHFDGRKDVFTEFKFGLDKELDHTNFFSDNVWVRGALDLFVASHNVLVVDYKTGKYKDQHKSDAEFYGAMTGCAYRQFKSVEVQYWYIDNPQVSFSKKVADCEDIMSRWAQLFKSAETIMDSGQYTVQQGPHCRWCTNYKCVHNANQS